jgi:LuxR family transcriptional regulator, maltose regulon positive regulatory protein
MMRAVQSCGHLRNDAPRPESLRRGEVRLQSRTGPVPVRLTAVGSHSGDVGPAPAGGGTSEREAVLRLDELVGASPAVLVVVAALLLAQGNPRAARKAIAPLLDGPISASDHRPWKVYALLLEAIAHKSLGDVSAAVYALERALDEVEPEHAVLSLILHSESTPRPSFGTTDAPPVSPVVDLLGRTATTRPKPQRQDRKPLRETLSDRETRILRFLPSHLSAPEIANELYVSVNTVKTHLRHVYAKLGVNSRKQAIERARVLGLLAP